MDDLTISGFSVNVCNDTVVKCQGENEEITMFNSTVIYRNKNGTCIRMAGPYFSEEDYLQKDGDSFYFVSTGDYCRYFENEHQYFTTKYLFKDTKDEKDTIDFNHLLTPDANVKRNCYDTLEISVNYKKHTDYLLIQKFFSDYHYFTGVVFLIIGVYLLGFAQFKKITKFTVGVVFGEISSFTFGVGLIGIKYIHMEWAFFIIGLALGGFVGYFCLGGSRLYRVILAFTAGFIFGVIIFDVLFTHLISRLCQILLFDTIMIFMSLALLIIHLQHSFHYFYNSIIGSYILVRGFCLLIRDAGKYARYRELQLQIYMLTKNEVDMARHFYEELWPTYYVYTIIMFIVMGGSIVFYYFKLYNKDEEAQYEKEKEAQNKLLKDKTTSLEDIKEPLD
jgi:hypothetical protein